MIKTKVKKGAALLLCVSMLSGLSLSVLDSTKVHADTTSEPSVSAYADKTTLAGDTFKPTYKGVTFTGKVGKLKFGKDVEGNVQEWYILGSDSGVTENKKDDGFNTVIFADSNMISYTTDGKYNSLLQFQQIKGEISYDKNTMGEYTKGSPVNDLVFTNHYGASNIRKTLQSMETNTAYFNTAEQSLMNTTTVQTDDFREGTYTNRGGGYLKEPMYYTTTDKLYLGAWDYQNNRDKHPNQEGVYKKWIYVGSETDNKILAIDTYWDKPASENGWFWLRSPYSIGLIFSLSANPNKEVSYDFVSSSYGVRPASNLNLENVLFASAVQAVTSSSSTVGKIAAGEAMTLRLNGTEKNIGSVMLSGNTILVTRGTSKKSVSLVVQGKGNNENEETDWYYSEAIQAQTDEITKVAKATIKEKLKSIISNDDIDLTSCRIWLEITDDDGMLYAVNSTTHTHAYNDIWTAVDGKQHGHKCTDSDCPNPDDAESFKDKEDHTFNENGRCVVCDYDASDSWGGNPVKAEQGTCIKKGHEDYWQYDVNGDITYYRFSGETVLGIKVLESIPDLSYVETSIDPDNHIKERAYKNNNNSSTHLVLCAGCDAELGTASHSFVGNKCKDCGYTKSSNSSGGSGGSSSSGGSSYAKWIKDNKGWKYRYSDGTYAKGTTVTDSDGNKVEKVLWQKAGNGYYAFGSDGYLVTGWIYDRLEDKWYYCDENMGKLYGWFNEPQDGYWYYLSPSTGEALTGWHSINGKDYYFAAAPSAPTYSFDAVAGFWIYSNLNGNRPFGSMYANTVTPDNYQVDANGAWIH